MKFSILLPHFKNGKVSAYAVSQLLKFKGDHDIDIIVIDNNSGDGSIEYLNPFSHDITIVNYPKGKTQSHGIAFDFALGLGFVQTEYFITIESDSYPTKNNWLDFYENLIDNDFDSAGSLLQLSGGTYIHPAGALYKKSLWQEAKKYCDEIKYAYFPNAAKKDGFDSHLMVHNRIVDDFIKTPAKYADLPESYKNLTPLQMTEKMEEYGPVVQPFHNGMGKVQESVKTYGVRDMSDSKQILLDNADDLIYRVGYEPGQWLAYYQKATERKIYPIPTRVQWIEGMENQQQEYTIMQNGFLHLWAGSASLNMKGTEMNKVYELKQGTINKLYESLPKEQKIPHKDSGT